MNNNRILFVASVFPFANGGGAQATWAYLDATLDTFGRDSVTVMISDAKNIPLQYQDIDFIEVPVRSKMDRNIGYIRGYLSRFTQPLMRYLKAHSTEFEWCIINGSLTGGKAIPFINKLGIKTAVIYHNYEIEYHKDNRTIESLRGKYLGMIKRIESLSYRKATLNLFLTKQDLTLFHNAYGKSQGNDFVIGTFDYKDREVEKILNVDKIYDISVSGSLQDYQTTVGIDDFFTRYLAVAEQNIKNLKVVLTGRNPSERIQELANVRKDVFTIKASPEAIFPIVQSGRIYLCPTCIGGGLKLRAMDGLKCGMPILVHEVSARGYDFYYNKPYYRIYRDKHSFEQGLKSILQYLENTHNSSEIINNDYYEYFGYQKGLERFVEAFNNR